MNKEFITFCLDNLDWGILEDRTLQEYSYPSLSLCAVDAVFSINTKYEAVKNVIGRIEKLAYLNSLNSFSQWLSNNSVENLNKNYFNNQIVAGRLKIEILKDFIKVLIDHNFLEKKDFENFITNEKIDQDLDYIRGIGDTTISYFFMLAGDKNKIKPDRHIKKFISDRLKIPLNTIDNKRAIRELELILPDLQKKYPNLTLRDLDHLIWRFQRHLSKNTKA